MRFVIIFLATAFYSTVFAQQNPIKSVTCMVGNAAAPQGPGYQDLELNRHPSETTVELRLGEVSRTFVQAWTVMLRYGHKMAIEDLRGEPSKRFGNVTDLEIEELYKKYPSAIDFQVTGTLNPDSVKLRIARELRPFDNAIGIIVFDKNPKEIVIERSKFGLPFVVGDLGIVCTEQK